MALGKMLNLGGIDNRPPKANQSLGRFRVARNVYPTPDGRIIPRPDVHLIAGQPSNIKCVHDMALYNDDMLNFVSEGTGGTSTENLRIYKNQTAIPQACYMGLSPYNLIGGDFSQSVQSYRRNNTMYWSNPIQGELYKYDGVQISYAGMSQPVFSCADANAAGTKFIRVIQHGLDFDNNEPLSELVEFKILNAVSSTTVRVDGGATSIIGNAACTKPLAQIATTSNYTYFNGTVTYSAGTSDFPVTTTATNIGTLAIGSYVFVRLDAYNSGTYGLPTGLGIALKVKSVSPLVLDANDAKYMDRNREWKTQNITNSGQATALAATISWGTQTFLSFYRSVSQNGIYYFCGYGPSFPSSTTSYTYIVDTDPATSAESGYLNTLSILGPILNDFYDVNSRKLSFNSQYPWGGDIFNFCITSYQDLLLYANDDLIFFSDTTLGGSFEQSNTSNFIKVGGKEFGRVTSICGTQDFLFVGRERKNYYVVGDISTGNYRVQEISEAEVGPWSNTSTFTIKDTVVFINSLGVYQVMSGGRAELLSKTCPKNFSTYDAFSINEDVVFRLEGFVSNAMPYDSGVDNGMAVAYDEYRELLVFMLKGSIATTGDNACFVLHTKTGEFYEWNKFYNLGALHSNSIAFKKGRLYVGQVDDLSGTSRTAKIYFEDFVNSSVYTYMSYAPCILYSTWLTASEPSLEKELLQLKLFGRIDPLGGLPTGAGIKVSHFKDWNILTKITDNVNYTPQGNYTTQFSHKKRLTSDKVLSASVGFICDTPGVRFEIESFEVEFNPIQSGMKK